MNQKQDRRDFLKKASLGAASIGAFGFVGKTDAKPKEIEPATKNEAEVQPSAAQAAWQALGFGMFVHFSINTFNDTEWSDGTLKVESYNPGTVDTDQWCRTARAAGMNYVVIITKHHDGFCNWPSKYTDYSVKSTPFGKDLVRMVADSAAKYGLKLGLYYSLWDRHERSHDTDEAKYIDYMKSQLEELLTGYGPVVEMWFDGFWKKQSTGWKGADGKTSTPENMMAAWRNEGSYRWQMDHIYQYIKKLQPDCMVMNNATTDFPGVPLFPCDIRSGEKATGTAEDRKIWNFAGKDQYLPLQIETTMSQQGKDKMFSSGSWFWHEWDHSSASVEMIEGWLEKSKSLNANLLLNVGPSNKGKLRPEDEKVLLALGKKRGIK